MLGALMRQVWDSVRRRGSGKAAPAVDGGGLSSLDLAGSLNALLREPRSHPKALNYETIAWFAAAVESADYMTSRMASASNLVERKALLGYALDQCTVSGLIMEFGVYRGETLRMIAQLTRQEVHGFDSFEGLPEDWTYFQKKGRFSLHGEELHLPEPNIRVHPGLFEHSLPRFLAACADRARFVHVDCDLYSSTRTVLSGLRDRLVPGTVLVFDEYLNYPGWRQHEYRAFREFVQDAGICYEYLGFASADSSVAVRITSA